MRQAELAIDELLTWEESHPTPSMSEIEAVILAFRKRLGEVMAQEVLSTQAERRPVPKLLGGWRKKASGL